MSRLLYAACLLLATATTPVGAGDRDEPAPERLTLASPGSPELTAAIAAKDSELFNAVFRDCNLPAIAALTTEDFEFYHDQWGLTAQSRDEFVASIRRLCERQARGEDYKSRRELVSASLMVQPLGKYGAIEVGVHRFYRLTPGQADTLDGEARFSHVWKNDNGHWRLARVISYEHRATPDA